MKYSIVIPTYNGLPYLKSCVNTILHQDFSDYELIISDDHSIDGTTSYLETLKHPSVRILRTGLKMSMAEHWEWALSQAVGKWLIVVGQDDGLQPYFFDLADKLTEIAERRHLRTVMSARAYFFWRGCEFAYGDLAVQYNARFGYCIKNYSVETFRTLCGLQNYFELPQMYTTSIFHKDLIEEVRRKQQGKIFVTHPQDANLAAIACSLEKKYLFSNIPLGWVGTSPKSAGLAIVTGTQNGMDNLKDEYLTKTKNSSLNYDSTIGDFTFASTVLYFWGALRSTRFLRKFPHIYERNFWKNLVFGAALRETKREGSGCFGKTDLLFKIILDNDLTEKSVRFYSEYIIPLLEFVFNTYALFNVYIVRLNRKVRTIQGKKPVELSFVIRHSEIDKLTLDTIPCDKLNQIFEWLARSTKIV